MPSMFNRLSRVRSSRIFLSRKQTCGIMGRRFLSGVKSATPFIIGEKAFPLNSYFYSEAEIQQML